MRFLVDAQLPLALARWLSAAGHEAAHVNDLGLSDAEDRAIWSRAAESGATIISKDEDFYILRTTRDGGPAVVWLRVGNVRKTALLAWIEPLLPQIVAALRRGETLVEVN